MQYIIMLLHDSGYSRTLVQVIHVYSKITHITEMLQNCGINFTLVTESIIIRPVAINYIQ